MNDEEAVKELKRLTAAGVLEIITAEHACAGGRVPHTAEQQAKCANHQPPPTHPRHWVCHRVVRIEGPNDQGFYSAYSKEGDLCMGRPQPLLRKLLQAPLSVSSERGFAAGREVSGELVAWMMSNPAGM